MSQSRRLSRLLKLFDFLFVYLFTFATFVNKNILYTVDSVWNYTNINVESVYSTESDIYLIGKAKLH